MQIRDTEYHGLAAIELIEGRARAVVVHQVGPRIAAFGRRDADSLLYWDATGELGRGPWKLRGGHRLWLTRPFADEAEETYAPDNGPCRVRRVGGGVAITAPPDPLRIEKSLVIRARGGAWTIEHRVRNTGDMLWSGGAWTLTCTQPRRSTRYRIPLDGGPPAWDVVTMVIPRRWGGGHTSRLADPQFVLTDDALEIRSRRAEAKRMLRAPRGLLEMVDDERGAFSKQAVFDPHARYPLATNVAIYLAPDSSMVELETMSPLVTLAPGETLRHVETWMLRRP